MELAFENVTAGYGNITALNDVSFSVQAGTVTCIVGPNGAGKSTIANLAAGLIQPTQGTVSIDQVIQNQTLPERRAQSGISLVPEGREIFSTLTVEENLNVSHGVFEKNAGHKQWKDEIRKIYDRFPILKERRNAFAGNLSGGEQQQLAICRALLTNPKLLIIDEPSLGLSPQNTDLVYEILADINAQFGLTLLIIEQNANRVMNVADRVIVLRNGKIQLNKRRTAIKGVEELTAAFFGYETQSATSSQAVQQS